MTRWIFGALAALVMIAAGAGQAAAKEYAYSVADGYYYCDGVPYTQQVSYTWERYYDYTYCRWVGYWKPYYTYTAVATTTTSYSGSSSGSVRSQIIQAFVDRAASQNKAALREQSHKQDLELALALGFNGTAGFNGVFGANTLSPYGGGSLQLSSAGYQGNSIWGYNATRQQQTTYGAAPGNPIDPMVFGMQASRHVQQAGELFGAGMQGYQGFTRAAIQEQQRQQEYQLRMAAVSQFLRDITPPPSQTTTTTSVTATPVPQPQQPPPVVVTPGPQPAPQPQPVPPAKWLSLSGPQKCVVCHDPGKAKEIKGKFDISRYHPATATIEQMKVVKKYLSKEDPEHFCPPADKPQLSPGEMASFFLTPPGVEMPAAKQ